MGSPASDASSIPAVRVTNGRALASLLVVQLLFGAMPVVGKLAIAAFGASGVAFLRMAGGMIAFQTLRAVLRLPGIPLRDQPAVALCAVLGVSANQLLFLNGLSRTSATHAALLTTSIPVLTMLVAAILGRERLHARRVLGIVVALAGVLTLILGKDPTGKSTHIGDLLIFGNATVYAAYLVLSRDLLSRHAPLSVLAWLFTWGLLTALPFTGLPTLEGHTTEGWLAVTFIVLGPTIASYWLNLYALRSVPASVVALFIYLQPPIAAAMAIPLLDERPTARLGVSALLTFAGVWLATRPKKIGSVRGEG
ncbi:MAG: DMT family transporter [Pseudomonadota bacterium]|nr:DMT family transporter [Pseudomonadota bacterium]